LHHVVGGRLTNMQLHVSLPKSLLRIDAQQTETNRWTHAPSKYCCRRDVTIQLAGPSLSRDCRLRLGPEPRSKSAL
jgi:hypothetical protein